MILRTGGKTKKKTLLTLHFLSTAHVTMTRYEPSNQQFTLIHTLSHRSNRLVKQKLFPSQLKQCHCLYNLSLWLGSLRIGSHDITAGCLKLSEMMSSCWRTTWRHVSLWTTKVPLFKRQVNYSLAERGSKISILFTGCLWYYERFASGKITPISFRYI